MTTPSGSTRAGLRSGPSAAGGPSGPSTANAPAFPPGPSPARLAVGARGLLAEHNTAGVLDAADVHVATRLGRLTREDDERVLLAVALAVRGVRAGSVCVDLAAGGAARRRRPSRRHRGRCRRRHPRRPSPSRPPSRRAGPSSTRGGRRSSGARSSRSAWTDPADRPARWVGGRLYLDRYWRHEQVVRREVDGRLAADPFAVDPVALAAAVRRHFPDATRPDAAPGRTRRPTTTAASAWPRPQPHSAG